MEWRRKNGQAVLEKDRIICKVSDDGNFVIKSPEGHWDKRTAENVEAAKLACENYVANYLQKKQELSGTRKYLEFKEKWVAQHKKDIEAIKLVLKVVHQYYSLSDALRASCRQEIGTRTPDILKLIDDPTIAKQAGELNEQEFLKIALNNYIQNSVKSSEQLPCWGESANL